MDPYLFISDVFYARHLQKHGHVLWASPSDKPDLGGQEEDDHRLMTDMSEGRSIECNNPGGCGSPWGEELLQCSE